MRRLLLLRHFKSSWDDPGLPDHDRPLAPRGRRAAKAMAEHLRRQSAAPGLVLCSSARRTRESLDAIAAALREPVTVRVERGLYAAPSERLLDRVRQVGDDVDVVLLIGHNPGLEDLALVLSGGGERLADLERKFPTGALATLELAGRWEELAPGTARLTGFVTPKELRGA